MENNKLETFDLTKENSSIIAIIPTHYRPDYFENALESILNQTIKCDILIIDSGHSEYTKNVIQKHIKETNQKIIHKEIENISPANNFYEGFKIAYNMGYEWIWVMDDDAEADNRALEELLKYKGISDGVLASTVFSFDGEISFFHRRHIKNQIIFNEINSSFEDYQNDYFEVDTISYVSLLIKSEILKEINFNNINFVFQYDDTDISLKIRKTGRRILNISKSKVFHDNKYINEKSISKKYEYSIKDFLSFRNRMYILEKYSKNHFLAEIYNFYTLMRAIAASLLKKRYKGYKYKRFKGFIEAYRSRKKLNLKKHAIRF